MLARNLQLEMSNSSTQAILSVTVPASFFLSLLRKVLKGFAHSYKVKYFVFKVTGIRDFVTQYSDLIFGGEFTIELD